MSKKLYRVSVEIDVQATDPISAKAEALEQLKALPIEKLDYKDGDYESITVELMGDV